MESDSKARIALLAGASGLVGRHLLAQLLESPSYRHVHVLLRRNVAGMPSQPKLSIHLVDFDRPSALPAVDDVYIALGTTIKVAGSQAAFRRVDFDAVVNTARAARAAGARRLLVVSALGADAGSRVFYNRVKGEMQQAVTKLGYESVVIAQPSLLMGNRATLGQPLRPGEVWALRLMRPFTSWLSLGVRPIQAEAVARSMLRAAITCEPGVTMLTSREMQQKHA